jgi:hypothetical protein
VIEDVGKRVLTEFSQRLEQKIAGPGSGDAPAADPAPFPGGTAVLPSEPLPSELDVGSLLTGTPAVRVGAAVALTLLALLIVLRRRR